jgi:hypothetical protein
MRMILSNLVVAGLASFLCWSARADERTPLAAGLLAYDKLEYARAVKLLEEARARAAQVDDRITIARTLAFAHVALDETEPAMAEFHALLTLAPTTTLDRTVSPRVREVFERARREEAALTAGAYGPSEEPEEETPPAPPATELAPLAVALTPARPRAGRPLQVSLGALHGASALLFYRTRGDFGFAQVAAQERGGRIELAVPGGDVKEQGLEYCVQTLDEDGQPVGGAGSLEHPLLLDVPTPPRPFYRRWKFWVTSGGVAVAGAAIGIIVGVVRGMPAHVAVQAPAVSSAN